MSKEIEIAVNTLLVEAKITVSATYAGQTKRDNWECDAWRFVFERQTRPDPSKPYARMTQDYYTGLGHRKSKTPMPDDIACLRPGILRRVEWEKQNVKPVAPQVAGVIHSLILDGEADDMSFSNWCDNFGYDTDSIRAFNIYQECCACARQAREFFGRDLLAQLKTATGDL